MGWLFLPKSSAGRHVGSGALPKGGRPLGRKYPSKKKHPGTGDIKPTDEIQNELKGAKRKTTLLKRKPYGKKKK